MKMRVLEAEFEIDWEKLGADVQCRRAEVLGNDDDDEFPVTLTFFVQNHVEAEFILRTVEGARAAMMSGVEVKVSVPKVPEAHPEPAIAAPQPEAAAPAPAQEQPVKRGPGRPPGSKNKPKEPPLVASAEVPAAPAPEAHPEPVVAQQAAPAPQMAAAAEPTEGERLAREGEPADVDVAACVQAVKELIPAAKLVEATIKEIIVFLQDQGVKAPRMLTAVCEALRADVPKLAKIPRMEDRVTRMLEILGSEADSKVVGA
jgi:hypothetical protein